MNRDPSYGRIDEPYYEWRQPPSPDCPDCPCCTARLCETAKEHHLPCTAVGNQGPGVMDITNCPCTKPGGAR